MVTINRFNEQCITFSQMKMITNTRLIFRRFTIWIRAYIISRYFSIGKEEESFQHLYSETSQIGDVFQIIFERDTSNEISQLLNRFTFAIRDLITAQLQGNSTAMNQNVNRLYQVAGNFAAFLASNNPYLDEAELRNLLEKYIQYTIEEANSFVAGNYRNDIDLYKRHMDITDKMSDMIAQSLYDYLMSGYSLTPQSNIQCITYEQMNQIFDLMVVWYELVTRTNAYMLSRYRGIGNAEDAKAYLKQLPSEYIDVLQQFFGKNLDTYLQQYDTYINLIDSLITAQIEGNINEINRVTQLLYQNADQRAAVIASLNPLWNEIEWRTRLYNRLRYTIDLSTAFLTGNYSSYSDILGTMLDLSESQGNYVARSTFNYLINQQKTSE